MSDTTGVPAASVDPPGGAAAAGHDPAAAAGVVGGAGGGQGEHPAGAADPAEPGAEEATRAQKRIAKFTAQLAASGEREAALAREAAELRARIAGPAAPAAPVSAELQAQIDAAVRADRAAQEAERSKRAADDRAASFHRAGEKLATDWHERCSELMDMGADGEIAMMLLDLDEDGPKVAMALSEDPVALRRIADYPAGSRARALALGRYAASVEAGEQRPAAAPAPRPVTGMPAPIRPVTGRAAPAGPGPNSTAQEWTDFYAKEAMAKRQSQQR